jgi:hypothetical protein
VTTLPLEPADVSRATARPAETESSRSESLQQRLASSLAQLRSRANDPARLERRIAIAGGTMAAAGVVLVLLGWYGASHTSRVYLQIPYLISGGLLGVVLGVAGGCTFLASWLTRLVQEERSRSDEALGVARDTAAALNRIEALLAAGAGSPAAPGSAPSPAPGRSAPLVAVAADEDTFVATPTGKLLHRPNCPTVAGRTDLRRVTPGTDGLAPCRMCGADEAVDA